MSRLLWHALIQVGSAVLLGGCGTGETGSTSDARCHAVVNDAADGALAIDTCPNHLLCEYGGLCGWIPGGPCFARDDSDCAAHLSCLILGNCVESEGACVAGDPDYCSYTDYCHRLGYCEAVGGVCRPTHPAHCERALNAEKGYLDGECRKEVAPNDVSACEQHSGCVVSGACGVRDMLCQPTSSEHCQKALVCHMEGRCALEGTRCVASSSADCAASVGCMSAGACSLKEGSCVATTTEECEKSSNCSSYGECILGPNFVCQCPVCEG